MTQNKQNSNISSSVKNKGRAALVEKFLTRGVEAIYPGAEELREKLNSRRKLRIYQGFDPTGPYLHVGHAIGIRALRILQELGHEVIFLVGNFTAKAGDPDKENTRNILTDEEIQKNMAGWQEQAAHLIDFSGDNPVRFKYNNEWLSRLKLDELIQLMSKTTVQRMIERDLFAKRIRENNPIRLHEFIYPLMQGYDGVAMEVDMEIGGADQTFNMLLGRELSKAYLNKEKFVRANKMMDAPDGRTMSKTKGNGINLADNAIDMYGKAMSYPDSAIARGLELLTDVPMEEIKEIGEKIAGGANPMQFKKLMAFEITKIIRGNQEAVEAEKHFEKTVQNKEKPEIIDKLLIMNIDYNILDLIMLAELSSSKSEARRLVEQGGVKINDDTIKDWKTKTKPADGDILKVGKRKFVEIKIRDSVK